MKIKKNVLKLYDFLTKLFPTQSLFKALRIWKRLYSPACVYRFYLAPQIENLNLMPKKNTLDSGNAVDKKNLLPGGQNLFF